MFLFDDAAEVQSAVCVAPVGHDPLSLPNCCLCCFGTNSRFWLLDLAALLVAMTALMTSLMCCRPPNEASVLQELKAMLQIAAASDQNVMLLADRVCRSLNVLDHYNCEALEAQQQAEELSNVATQIRKHAAYTEW